MAEYAMEQPPLGKYLNSEKAKVYLESFHSQMKRHGFPCIPIVHILKFWLIDFIFYSRNEDNEMQQNFGSLKPTII